MRDILSTFEIPTDLKFKRGPNRSLVHKLNSVYQFLHNYGPYGQLEMQLKFIAEDLLKKEFGIMRPDSFVNVKSFLATKGAKGQSDEIEVKYDENYLIDNNAEYSLKIYLNNEIHEILLNSSDRLEVGNLISAVEEVIREAVRNAK